MGYRKVVLAAVAAALLLCTLTSSASAAQPNTDCVCPAVVDPVCAEGDVTYGNFCEAACAGKAIKYNGQCADPSGCAAVLCPAIHDPVCGANNVTYPNYCQAACTGVTIVANTTCDATVKVKGGNNGNGGGAAGGGVRGGGNGNNGNGNGSGNNGNNRGDPEEGCVCPFIYQPVCGANNVTYGNACEAACLGIPVQYIGQCADEAGCAAVICPADYAPVCGANNVTYSNDCNAFCTGVTIVSEGECGTSTSSTTGSDGEVKVDEESGCGCPLFHEPMCGEDNVTYGNACEAACAGKIIQYVGQCADEAGCAAVICPADVAPVCGANNVTYSNECNAQCTGVTIVHEGECGSRVFPDGDEGEVGEYCLCYTDEFDPVCGKDGVSYVSPCYLECAKVELDYPGECNTTKPDGCAGVACIEIYQPVCGTDGVTYSNNCTASCSGATIAYAGECGKETPEVQEQGSGSGIVCGCTKELRWVCGADGVTYANPCLATCNGTTVAYDGRCADPSGCDNVRCVTTHDPVCGNDGVEYQNSCFADCTGVNYSPGPCEEPKKEEGGKPKDSGNGGNGNGGVVCGCTRELRWVCGADGVTYANPCLATCNGTTIAYDGRCADPSGCDNVRCVTTLDPVCGNDGVEYQNECFAVCTGVTYSPGACGSSKEDGDGDSGGFFCRCTKELRRMCGADGVTYANPCLATCNGTTVAYEGRCADPSGCDNVRCVTTHDPVCGNDGVEYQNECFAACTGVTYSPGPCKAGGKGDGDKKDGHKGGNGKSNKGGVTVVRVEGGRRNAGGAKGGKGGKGSVPRRLRSPSPAKSSKVGGDACAHCGEGGDPVCGADGITYGSACLAACSHVAVADASGPCPEP